MREREREQRGRGRKIKRGTSPPTCSSSGRSGSSVKSKQKAGKEKKKTKQKARRQNTLMHMQRVISDCCCRWRNRRMQSYLDTSFPSTPFLPPSLALDAASWERVPCLASTCTCPPAKAATGQTVTQQQQHLLSCTLDQEATTHMYSRSSALMREDEFLAAKAVHTNCNCAQASYLASSSRSHVHHHLLPCISLSLFPSPDH